VRRFFANLLLTVFIACLWHSKAHAGFIYSGSVSTACDVESPGSDQSNDVSQTRSVRDLDLQDFPNLFVLPPLPPTSDSGQTDGDVLSFRRHWSPNVGREASADMGARSVSYSDGGAGCYADSTYLLVVAPQGFSGKLSSEIRLQFPFPRPRSLFRPPRSL